MKASLFYLPSIGSRAEIEAGMAGMNPHFYQRMLKELTEQIKLGDALGYDSVSFTEHHFHIEGFELSNNPVLLDLYFAMQTKRIRVGQLGIVLPASNPIRVAEDIASGKDRLSLPQAIAKSSNPKVRVLVGKAYSISMDQQPFPLHSPGEPVTGTLANLYPFT